MAVRDTWVRLRPIAWTLTGVGLGVVLIVVAPPLDIALVVALGALVLLSARRRRVSPFALYVLIGLCGASLYGFAVVGHH